MGKSPWCIIDKYPGRRQGLTDKVICMYAYIYSRKRYKRVLVGLWIAYAVSFLVRVVLYIHVGPDALLMPITRILGTVGAGLLGAIVTMMIVRRKSSAVPKRTTAE